MDWQQTYLDVMRSQRGATGKAMPDVLVYRQIPFFVKPMGVQEVIMSNLPLQGQSQRNEWWTIYTTWVNGMPYIPKPDIRNGDRLIDQTRMNVYNNKQMLYTVYAMADQGAFLVMNAWTPAGPTQIPGGL